jgi:hypothetical protein
MSRSGSKARVREAEHSREELMEIMGEQIDRSITVCLRPRYNWGATPRLWEAAYAKVGRPLSLVASERLMGVLEPGDVVILSGGFVVPPAFPNGEVCGIAGVVALARGLTTAFGTRALFVSEEACLGPIGSVAQAAELRTWDYDVWMDRPAPFGTALYPFPIDDEEAKEEAARILDETEAKAIITVEKSDINKHGIHHTGLGEDMGPYTAKVEHLIDEANRRGVLTIGIGDVGNEIGFSLIHDEAAQIIRPYGTDCNCGCGGGIIAATPVDCLVVASCSNKGAYGIVGCLAGLTGNPEALHSVKLQRRMMDAVRDYPVHDAMTIRNTFTEDGAPGELSLALIKQLRWISEIPTWTSPAFDQARLETGW